jgi:hypothetical protein
MLTQYAVWRTIISLRPGAKKPLSGADMTFTADQTLYSQDLKLVFRAPSGAEAILRIFAQVCL